MYLRFLGIATAAALLTVGAACSKPTNSNTPTNEQQTVTVNTSVDTNANLPVIELTNPPATDQSGNTNLSGGTSAPSSASVSITSSGFSPATLTVGVGGTVTWTNSDSARHQPATDPHPTHTGLAGFDAIGGLSQGETFQFTFTRAGTFPYHDHTFPLRQGTVIVQ